MSSAMGLAPPPVCLPLLSGCGQLCVLLRGCNGLRRRVDARLCSPWAWLNAAGGSVSADVAASVA